MIADDTQSMLAEGSFELIEDALKAGSRCLDHHKEIFLIVDYTCAVLSILQNVSDRSHSGLNPPKCCLECLRVWCLT